MRNIRTNTNNPKGQYLDVHHYDEIQDGFLYNYTVDDDMQNSSFLTKEGIEAWWNDLVLLSSGDPNHYMMMSNLVYADTYTLDSLGPWKESFQRFIQRGLSRKSGDKLISDTIGTLKLNLIDAIPQAKFKQFQHPELGNLVIALNQPARLTLGLAYNHCLGRVVGSYPLEDSVAILTEDGCTLYYLFDRYMGPASPRNSNLKARIEEFELKKRFNQPCREYTPHELTCFETVARDFGRFVSREKAELKPHIAFMLALQSDLTTLNYWKQKGIEFDTEHTWMSTYVFIGGFGPYKIMANRWWNRLNLELLYRRSRERYGVWIEFDSKGRVESLFLPLSWFGESQEQYLTQYLTDRFGVSPDFDVYVKD